MDLAAVVLDTRMIIAPINAAAAVVELPDDSVLARLRPLAFANTKTIPRAGLKQNHPTLWPRHLSTENCLI